MKRRARRFEVRVPGGAEPAQAPELFREEPEPEAPPPPPERAPRRPLAFDVVRPGDQRTSTIGMSPEQETDTPWHWELPAAFEAPSHDSPDDTEAVDSAAFDAMDDASASSWADSSDPMAGAALPAPPEAPAMPEIPDEDVMVPGADDELELDRAAAAATPGATSRNLYDRTPIIESRFDAGGDMKADGAPPVPEDDGVIRIPEMEPITGRTDTPNALTLPNGEEYDLSALDALDELDLTAPAAPPEAEYPVPGAGFDPREGRGEDSVLRSDQMQGADVPEGWGEEDIIGRLTGERVDQGDGVALPSGEGFNDPDMSAPMRAEPALPGETGTDMDAAMGGARWYEDGGLEGTTGDVAGDDEAAEAVAGIDDDEVAEGESPWDLTDMDAGMGALEANPDLEVFDVATDEDPEIPGSTGPGEDFADFGPALSAMEGDEGGGMELDEPVNSKVPDAGDPARRLDAGLPSEGDISEASDWDIPRRILHALGSGLTASSGRSPTPFVSNADRLRGERREGMEDRLDTKTAHEEDASDAALTREMLNTRLASSEALGRERMESAETIAELRRKPTETDLGRLEIARAGDAREAATTEADSVASASARERLTGEVEMLRSSPRTREIVDALMEGRNIESLSAVDIEELETSIRPLIGDLTGPPGRGRGGAGGGGGGRGRTRAAQIQEMLRLGLATDEEGAARLVDASAGMADNIIASAAGRADTRGTGPLGLEFIENIHTSIPMSPPFRAQMLREWNGARDAMGAMRRLETVAREAGFAERLADPEFGSRIAADIGRMRGMAAIANGTGVINPSEMEMINRMIPDPASGREIVADAFPAQLNAWRNQFTGILRTRLGDLGVPEDELSAAMTALITGGRVAPSGGSAPAAEGAEGGAPPAGIRIRRRDGSGEITIPPGTRMPANMERWEVVPEVAP